MKVGNVNQLPQYSVHGDKTNFYLWVNEDGKGVASKWIKGRLAFQLWTELEKRLKKNKDSFIELLKYHHKNNLKL